MRGGKNETKVAISIAYIHGRIEREIEGFADSLGVPKAELAARLGALLCGAPGGQVLGTADRVPHVPAAPAESGGPSRPVALASGTRGGQARPMEQQKRGKLAGTRQEWWWKLTKKQRQAIKDKRAATVAAQAKQAA